MSEVKTDKLTPRTASGTIVIGESGDTVKLSGATVNLPAAAVTTHVTQFDDNNLKEDIALL